MKAVLKSVAAYAAAAGLCLLLLVWVMHLWRVDWKVPFQYGFDALWMQSWVKGLLEGGWYLHNDHLGAPFGQDLHDFPLVDTLFFVLLKLVALVVHDSAAALNVYFVLTFPLTTLSALFVLRRLGCSYGPALAASLLYAFLPHHFLRGEQHLFLASYFLVPLLALVALELYLDAGLFFRWEEETGEARWAPWNGKTLGAVVVCLVAGAGGVYYAFFGCYLFLIAALACCLRRRRAYPLGAALLLVGLTSVVVGAHLLPRELYARAHGPNIEAVVRDPYQADLFGLKPMQLLLPVYHHRLAWLRHLREKYDMIFTRRIPFQEDSLCTMGLVGSVGFLWLVGRLLARRRTEPRPADGLSCLNLFALLLASVGGFGTLFSFLISPWIRCYNRMSVYIAFFALGAVALLLDRALRRLRSPGARLFCHGLMVLLVVGGVLDQVSGALVPPYDLLKEEYASDGEFVTRIESGLPAGARIFQLPSVTFPEGGFTHSMTVLDPLRGYLHSRTLCWSHGGMRGRYGDRWRTQVAGQPLEEMLRTLAYAGFSGIYIDRWGYPDMGASIETDLARLLGSERCVSRNGRLSFFNMADYVARLREECGDREWARRQEWALYPVLPSWPSGFYDPEVVRGVSSRWAVQRADLVLTNESPRPRRVRLTMHLVPAVAEPASLRVEGPLWDEEMTIGPEGRIVSRTLVVPAGSHPGIRFHCGGRRRQDPSDPRPVVFRVANFKLDEVGE